MTQAATIWVKRHHGGVVTIKRWKPHKRGPTLIGGLRLKSVNASKTKGLLGVVHPDLVRRELVFHE